MDKENIRPILKRVSEARSLFETHGEALARDIRVSTLLEVYSKAICSTGQKMLSLGIRDECARCANTGPGSCCFQAIERDYDSTLLLINLLLGCELPKGPGSPDDCYFIGPAGCTLAARFYFCVHYLCPGLCALIPELGIQDLNRTVGEELAAGWDAERAILFALNKLR